MHHYNHLRGLLTSSSLVKGSRPLFSSSGIEKTKPEIDAKTKTAASIFEKSPSPEKSVFEFPEHLRRKMTECQCHHRGSIHLITGPMFSGKTTELFRLVRRHKLAGKAVVVIKSAKDTRYETTDDGTAQACTHDMNKMDAVSAYEIATVLEKVAAQYDVIGIDEGQFFPDVVPAAQELANRGKSVIVAALNGDFRQKPFPSVVALFALAEKIEKLSAVCHGCGHNSASFTARLALASELELIGGKEAYRAYCRLCLLDHHGHQQQQGVSEQQMLQNQQEAGKENCGFAKVSNGGDAPVVVDHKNNNNGEEDEGEKKMMVDVQSSPAVKPPHVGRRGAEQCA